MRACKCDYVRLLRNQCEEHKNAGIIFVECENCEACGILVKNGPERASYYSYYLTHSHPSTHVWISKRFRATGLTFGPQDNFSYPTTMMRVAQVYFTFIQFIFVGSALLVQELASTTSRPNHGCCGRCGFENQQLTAERMAQERRVDGRVLSCSSALLSKSQAQAGDEDTFTPNSEKTDNEGGADQAYLDKNTRYTLGLIDNLSSSLDKYILSGSKESMLQARNILLMIKSQTEDDKLIQRANRMFKRAGITPPHSTKPAKSDHSRKATTVMDGSAEERTSQAEQRLQWEEARKKPEPTSFLKENRSGAQGRPRLSSNEEPDQVAKGKEGRSALSRRNSVNGKPDLPMGQIVNPGLNAISSVSNDKTELHQALSESAPLDSSNKVSSEDGPQNLDEGAANKVAELVARAGAASSFKGESLGIGGLDDVLAEVKRRIWTPLAAPPRLLAELGICPVRGLLLYGRPGNGKTLLARKLGQILSPLRPITVVSGPEIMDKFIGSSEQNLREIFDNPPDVYDFVRLGEADSGNALAKAALHVIVMDEFDAIARSRGGRGGTGRDQSDAGVARDSVVNQLLAKMDGVDPLCVPTLVIGLTNKRSLIDPALLRPGRFEVQVEVPPPRNNEQRVSILKVHTRKMYDAGRLRLESSSSEGIGQDAGEAKQLPSSYEELLQFLAEKSDGFSGASLAGLARAAASHALERAVDNFASMDNQNVDGTSLLLRDCAVTLSDFDEAILDMRSGMGNSDFGTTNEEDENSSEVEAEDDSETMGSDSELD